jgi:hypothetical protein
MTYIAVDLRGKKLRSARPRLRSVEKKLEHVAAGNGIVVLPESTATFYTRPAVTHVHATGIAPSQVCQAWDNARDSVLAREYAEIARAAETDI